jgi:hypothetical protein
LQAHLDRAAAAATFREYAWNFSYHGGNSDDFDGSSAFPLAQ